MSGTPPTPEDRPVAAWWAIVKGMGTVFKQTFRADNTEQYPKEIAPPPERAHTGRHRLNRHENGLEKVVSSARTRARRTRSGSRGRTTIPTSR